MKISIVIPVYNEENNVQTLHQEIVDTMQKIGCLYEIIFVNDGSQDSTLDKLKALNPVTIINFRRNFGQTAALDAGIKQADGDVIVTLDGDGQNDPGDIPLLLAKMKEGFDVVSGWRWARQDGFWKNFTSRGAHLLRTVFIKDGINDSGCTLKAYRKECFNNVDLYGEMHRFIPGVLQWQGFTIAEVKVNHRPRTSGKTKYTFTRTLKGFLDIISVWFWRKYSARPLHLFGGVGFILFCLGSLLLVYLFLMRVFGLISLADSIWPLVGFFLTVIGAQLVIGGLLADALLKSYYRIHHYTPYAIKEILVKKQEDI